MAHSTISSATSIPSSTVTYSSDLSLTGATVTSGTPKVDEEGYLGLLGVSLNDFTEKGRELLGILAETLVDLGDIEEALTFVHDSTNGGPLTTRDLLAEVMVRMQAKNFAVALGPQPK